MEQNCVRVADIIIGSAASAPVGITIPPRQVEGETLDMGPPALPPLDTSAEPGEWSSSGQEWHPPNTAAAEDVLRTLGKAIFLPVIHCDEIKKVSDCVCWRVQFILIWAVAVAVSKTLTLALTAWH